MERRSLVWGCLARTCEISLGRILVQSVPDGCGRNRHSFGKQKVILEATTMLDTNRSMHLAHLFIIAGKCLRGRVVRLRAIVQNCASNI